MNDEDDIKKILERLERDQARKRTEESIQRSRDWLNRVQAGAVGFVIGTLFLITLSECTRLSSRVSALESKQK